MRATGRQHIEALRDNMGMPGCFCGKRQLVTGSSERAGKREQRPEVAIEGRRAEKDADRTIISYGKNCVARIVYVRDGDV
jgi:hypothetical protein